MHYAQNFSGIANRLYGSHLFFFCHHDEFNVLGLETQKSWNAFNLEIVQKRSPGSLLENVHIPTPVLYVECATDLVFGFIGVGDFDLTEFLAL